MTSLASGQSLKKISLDLRSGKLSLTGYIEETLLRMEENEPLLHSFVPEENRKVRLLLEAKALLERFPKPETRPPLFGVLVGIKDIIYTEHLPTYAGSRLPASAFKGNEAEIVTKLKEAGALILGKTACTEFAYFQPGKTTNPHNPDHTPGGSSSGSAAAVASGISPLTIGSQTIASIIRPAAYCGVFGFKPGFGRISMCGFFPFSQSADHGGFFASDLTGIKIAAKVVINNWKEIETPIKPILGIPSEEYLNQADTEALESFQETVLMLQNKGFEIHRSSLFENISYINEIHQDLIAAEFSHNHKDLFRQYGNLYSKHSVNLYLKGLQISSERIKEAQKQQSILRYKITEVMELEEVDLWITPAATSSAPKGLQSTGSPLMSLPWTFAGLPSISIPSGKNSEGLPFGLQLVSSFGEDETLLAGAESLLDHTQELC